MRLIKTKELTYKVTKTLAKKKLTKAHLKEFVRYNTLHVSEWDLKVFVKILI